MTGEVAFLPVLTGVAKPLLEDGRARALATTSPQRHADLPDVPTTAGLGFPSVDLVPWWGLFAPPSLDAPAAQRLATAIAETGRDPSWSSRLETLSVEPVTFDGVRTAEEIARQIASWRARLAGRTIN